MMTRVKKKKKFPRITALCVIMALVVAVYSASAFGYQVVNRSKYSADADTLTVRQLAVKSARGQILDRYGRVIAYNTQGYSLVFDAAYLSKSRLNSVILSLSKVLTSAGEEWNDLLPLSDTAPYGFDETDESGCNTLRTKLSLNRYATAQNCWDAMVERYELQDYDAASARVIMGVRYSMQYRDYSILNPYTFADDVSISTVTIVEENPDLYKGVNAEVVATREYDTGITLNQIIGTIGPIYAEEWEKLSAKGYSYNDKTGKGGLEETLDDLLHGEDGVMTITQDASGNVLSEEITQKPVNGNTITLTIDKKLQEVAYKALETRIKQLQETKNGAGADAGAVVVIENNTGAILAAANYPSYTADTYKYDYDSLVTAEGSPLFNRCFFGSYEPGSAMKPATALIGLQTGNITADEIIHCSGKYYFADDYNPKCLGVHEDISVSTALTVSCNTFFYEVGRRVGIEKLNEFCKKFGLGVKTGVETGESAGILAGLEYRQKLGIAWQPGDTIQAAIGQSDNNFTPVQLAAYTATVANKGTLYSAHLVDSVYSYELDQLIDNRGAEVVSHSGIDLEHYSVVHEGMRGVATVGTVRSEFADYDVAIAAKTGTAQVVYKGEEYTNGILITFAPYEDPEISVVVVIEKGGYGSYCAEVARDIYDYYFGYSGESYTPQKTDVLL